MQKGKFFSLQKAITCKDGSLYVYISITLVTMTDRHIFGESLIWISMWVWGDKKEAQETMGRNSFTLSGACHSYLPWEEPACLFQSFLQNQSRYSFHWRKRRGSLWACEWPGWWAACWEGCSLPSGTCTRWGAEKGLPGGRWWDREPRPSQQYPQWYWFLETETPNTGGQARKAWGWRHREGNRAFSET